MTRRCAEQYICRHFKIQELVPRHVYQERGDKAWQLLDWRLLFTIDCLRDDLYERFGTFTVNNWLWGGGYEWSGLRTPKYEEYSIYSQHNAGRAVDGKFQRGSAEAIRQIILDNPERYPYINAVELDVDWLHIDCRNCDRIFTFSPN